MVKSNPSAGSSSPSHRDGNALHRADVLSGEDYPELNLRPLKRRAVEAPPEANLPEPDDRDEKICRDIQDGKFQESSIEECQRLLSLLLEQGRISIFTMGVEQLVSNLDSDQIAARRWSMGTIRALALNDSQAVIPQDTLALFLGAVGRCVNTEPDDALRNLAEECTALLVGSVAVSGNLAEASRHLVGIIQYAGASGAALQKRIFSSMSLSLAPLRLYFREGRSILENRLLPLFRMAGPDGCRSLIQCLEAEENRQRRSRILEILKALTPLSSEPVKESLDAETWYLVRNALNLLGELGDPHSFESASRFLEHPDFRIRRAAVRAFWKTGGPRAESYLLDLLPRSDRESQDEILVGLVQIQAPSAAAPIARLAIQGEEPLRIKCLEALGQLGDLAQSEALPVLAKCLERKGRIIKKGESAVIREAAAKALVTIGTPEAISILAHAIQDASRSGDQETLRKIMEKPIWA